MDGLRINKNINPGQVPARPESESYKKLMADLRISTAGRQAPAPEPAKTAEEITTENLLTKLSINESIEELHKLIDRISTPLSGMEPQDKIDVEFVAKKISNLFFGIIEVYNLVGLNDLEILGMKVYIQRTWEALVRQGKAKDRSRRPDEFDILNKLVRRLDLIETIKKAGGEGGLKIK
jgi:hypothetical protein